MNSPTPPASRSTGVLWFLWITSCVVGPALAFLFAASSGFAGNTALTLSAVGVFVTSCLIASRLTSRLLPSILLSLAFMIGGIVIACAAFFATCLGSAVVPSGLH
ncbi:hypothetical protein [Prosthecobacter sp.]|uniref:hypothetical protein n=1 Tax=Prosthecobacter sp. TaxID=1965333 RepID=UPI001D522C9F|nr:hypothetical protein [Prosthecobacter sp.]MCB1274994.1 hypothetical protein [Prosthecobacter sp.]